MVTRLWRPARPARDMGHVTRDLGAETDDTWGSLDHSHRVRPGSRPRHTINLRNADNLWSVINSLETFFWNKHVYYCLFCPLARHQHISHQYVDIRPPALTPAIIRLGPIGVSEPESDGVRSINPRLRSQDRGPREPGEPGHTLPELKSFRFRHKTDKTQHTLGQTTTHKKSGRNCFCL